MDSSHSFSTQAGGGGGGGEAGAAPGLKLVNRLGESRSPYVRGHKDNPVAWQMWTPEALALARKEDKLLFVSIGYSACHCMFRLLLLLWRMNEKKLMGYAKGAT
jgi:hypothetical protein